MSIAAVAPERLGVGRRLLWLWILVAGVVSYLLVLRTLVVTQNINFVPSLLLLGSAVVPASVLPMRRSGRAACSSHPASGRHRGRRRHHRHGCGRNAGVQRTAPSREHYR